MTTKTTKTMEDYLALQKKIIEIDEATLVLIEDNIRLMEKYIENLKRLAE